MKNSKQIKQHLLQATKGFTLIESMVAISVLLLAVTSVLFVVSKSVSFSGVARDQITAFYLAQDAIECIKNKRDNNSLAGESWLGGLGPCMGGTCMIESRNCGVVSCSGQCPPLKLSEAGIYNYDIGEDTIFRREVEIQEISPGREATLDVTLRWKRRLIERDFTIREHLFNWK